MSTTGSTGQLCGWLHKKGEKNKAWKRRWFSIKGTRLHYYENEHEKREDEKGSVDLKFIDSVPDELLPVSEACPELPTSSFRLVSGHRIWYLAAPTPEIARKWIADLREVLPLMKTVKTFKNGFLQKRGEINPAWKTRWFSLTKEGLEYFKERTDTKAAGLIPLQNVEYVTITDEKTGLQFDIKTAGRVYQVKGTEAADVKAWVECLRERAECTPESYDLSSTLGEGGTAIVFSAQSKISTTPCALKVMEMVNANPIAGAFAEKTCLQEMGIHPFLVKFLRTFHDRTRLFVAMELVKGQPLYTIMTQQAPSGFSEECVRFIMAETVLVLDHLHKRGIIYRDLKLENILLTESGNIKLIDLGYAKNLYDIHTEKAWSKLGTPEYMAPEMLDEVGHSFHVDLWALGVIIFELLLTYTPFVAGSIGEIFDRIGANQVTYPSSLSPTVIDLISGLLKTYPSERLTLNEVKAHPWFSGIVWDAETLAANPPADLVRYATEANNNFKKAVVSKEKTGGGRLRLPVVEATGNIKEQLELEEEFADF